MAVHHELSITISAKWWSPYALKIVFVLCWLRLLSVEKAADLMAKHFYQYKMERPRK